MRRLYHLLGCPCSKSVRTSANDSRVETVVQAGVPSSEALASLFCPSISSAAQLVSNPDVYVLDLYEEVDVGMLIRWLFRLLLFRVLVNLWRIIRRR